MRPKCISPAESINAQWERDGEWPGGDDEAGERLETSETTAELTVPSQGMRSAAVACLESRHSTPVEQGTHASLL